MLLYLLRLRSAVLGGRRGTRSPVARRAAEAAVTILVLGLVAAGVFVRATTAAQPPAQAIAVAPAFSMDELAALPVDNWITNGGSLANQRYSSLDEINTSNVMNLKGLWLTHLNSATAAK